MCSINAHACCMHPLNMIMLGCVEKAHHNTRFNFTVLYQNMDFGRNPYPFWSLPHKIVWRQVMTEDSSEMHVNAAVNRALVCLQTRKSLTVCPMCSGAWVSQGVETGWSGQCKVVSFYCRIYFVQHLLKEKSKQITANWLLHATKVQRCCSCAFLQCDLTALRIVANHRHFYWKQWLSQDD